MSKKQNLHGVQVRFGKGAKLSLLSYAVFVNGVEQVSHSTTRELRRSGHDLKALAELEAKRQALPVI